MAHVSLARPRLTVRLDALADNYQQVARVARTASVGAAVKGDAYGLGLEPVVRCLWAEGCREFFVANVDEGIAVRSLLADAAVNVFNGAMPGTEEALLEHRLVPLVISSTQLDLWAEMASKRNTRLPVGIHVDTGMHRTGMSTPEVDALIQDPALLDRFDVRHVFSHLASADDPESSQPEEQLTRFREIRRRLPGGIASLANSAGTFRSADFHFDLVRPGIALFGGSPVSGAPSPMRPTAVLEAPVLQLRDVVAGDRVGYGATYTADRAERHATVPVGYADGYHRSASGQGSAWVGGAMAPVVGRVSMDLIIVDVTGLAVEVGDPVELLGEHCLVDDVAARAGTISYEILTSLGRRFERVYVD